jgi:hypothetical protein
MSVLFGFSFSTTHQGRWVYMNQEQVWAALDPIDAGYNLPLGSWFMHPIYKVLSCAHSYTQ